MAEHWRLPPVDQGWQTYQPPLSYALTAAFGVDSPRGLQSLGLVLSVLALFAGLRTVHRSLPERLRATVPVADWFLASHPSLLLFAPRVNHEGLLTLLAFTTVLFAVSWWRRGETRDWTLAACSPDSPCARRT